MSAPDEDGAVISSTACDTDGDGKPETVEIAIIDGRRYTPESQYCGGGGRWEGSFEIRIRRDSRILSRQPLNALMGKDSLFFWTPEFQLVLNDYNGDGLLDFNVLSSEGGCNGSHYRLFTIDRKGGVRSLSGREFYATPPHANSTSCIVGIGGLLGVISYSQETGTYVADWYAWQDDDWVLVRREAPYDPK
jgi:hypothetical protein